MTLQDLGNFAQIVNSIAVVVSLIYLVIQVRLLTIQGRTNTRLAQLELQENFISAQQEDFRRIAENPELYRIWLVGTTQYATMTGEDRERFGFLLYGQMYRYYMAYQAASLEPLVHTRGMIQIDRLARLPAFQSWWERQRVNFAFDPGFVTFVNERITGLMPQASTSTPNIEP